MTLWVGSSCAPLYHVVDLLLERQMSGSFMRAAALCFQQLFNSHKLDIVPLQGVTSFSQTFSFISALFTQKPSFIKNPLITVIVFTSKSHTQNCTAIHLYTIRSLLSSKFHCGGDGGGGGSRTVLWFLVSLKSLRHYLRWNLDETEW